MRHYTHDEDDEDCVVSYAKSKQRYIMRNMSASDRKDILETAYIRSLLYIIKNKGMCAYGEETECSYCPIPVMECAPANKQQKVSLAFKHLVDIVGEQQAKELIVEELI